MKTKTTIKMALLLASGFVFAAMFLDYNFPMLSDNSYTSNNYAKTNINNIEEIL